MKNNLKPSMKFLTEHLTKEYSSRLTAGWWKKALHSVGLKYDEASRFHGKAAKEAMEKLAIADERYRQYICKELSTYQLEVIMECHRLGLLERTEATLQAITSELFEREVLNECF